MIDTNYGQEKIMNKSIAAGEFKQHCLALINEVALSGKEVVITKYGKPLCRITPLLSSDSKNRFGKMKETMQIHGDITKPTGVTWKAEE